MGSAGIADLAAKREALQAVSDLSQRFYELVPHKAFHNKPVRPIVNMAMLGQKVAMMEQLGELAIAARMLLGAKVPHAPPATSEPLRHAPPAATEPLHALALTML